MSELMNCEQVVRNYDPALSIKVYAESGTKTKMSDTAPNTFGGDPNIFVIPVSPGLFGCLSVVDKRVVECVIRIGPAPSCEITEHCRFTRKDYFCPNLMKAFRTSQSDGPIARDGYVDAKLEDGTMLRVEIERTHMGEDTGKNTHVGGVDDRIHGADYPLVSYNRVGVSPVETVVRPITGAGERAPEVAATYVQILRDTLHALGVSEVKMGRGSVRADINISPRNTPDSPLGVRSETKNVNSFRGIASVARSKIQCQGAVLVAGGMVVQETRCFHEEGGFTSTGREKSDTEDYRYFPEPDLVPLVPTYEWVEEPRVTLSEFLVAKCCRLREEQDYIDKEMRGVVNVGVLEFIEAIIKAGIELGAARKWWMGELSRRARENESALEDMSITPAQIAELQDLIDSGRINDELARQALEGVLMGEGSPAEVVEARGLKVISDEDALRMAAQEVTGVNPAVVEKIRGGRVQASGALAGAIMKATRGQVDAVRVRGLIMEMVGV